MNCKDANWIKLFQKRV